MNTAWRWCSPGCATSAIECDILIDGVVVSRDALAERVDGIKPRSASRVAANRCSGNVLMADGVDVFLQAVLRSGLMNQDTLQDALRDVPVSVLDKPPEIAKHLIHLGKLSRFQAHKLLSGATRLASWSLSNPDADRPRRHGCRLPRAG